MPTIHGHQIMKKQGVIIHGGSHKSSRWSCLEIYKFKESKPSLVQILEIIKDCKQHAHREGAHKIREPE